MPKRLLVLGIGVTLLIATAHVLLLIEGRDRDKEGAEIDRAVVTVLVSKHDIPANQKLIPLIERGVFVQIDIPAYAIVEGVVTDVSQMEGAITTTKILKNEQISTARLTSDR